MHRLEARPFVTDESYSICAQVLCSVNLCGMRCRYAPESIKEQKFTSQSDVWSYGVTNWEMFELWGSNKEYATPYNDLNPSEV